MRKVLAIFLSFFSLILITPLPSYASEPPKTTTLTANTTINRDYFAGNERVIVSGNIDGDVYLAGGDVSFDGTTSSDVIALGGNINISGKVEGNVRVAGGNVNFSGAEIAGNVTVFGGSINIDPSTTITGSVVAAGGNLQFLGPIGKSLTVAGGNIVVGGDVGRDIWSPGVESLRLTKGAKVHGQLTYTSNLKAVIDQGALVTGTVKQKTPPVKTTSPKGAAVVLGFVLFFWISDIILSLILGLLLIYFLPNYVNKVTTNVTQNPGSSFLLGLLLAIVVPVVLLVIMLSIIGIPIAFALLVIFIFTLWISKIFTSIAIGLKVMGKRTKPNMYLALLIGLAIYFVLSILPVLGRLIQLAITVTGFGAFALAKKSYYEDLRKKKVI